MKERLFNLLVALSLLAYFAAGAAAVAGNRGGFRLGVARWCVIVHDRDLHGTERVYWLGAMPGRLMLVEQSVDSGYGAERVETVPAAGSGVGWEFSPLGPSQGVIDVACPTTYPLRHGFALANEDVSLSSH